MAEEVLSGIEPQLVLTLTIKEVEETVTQSCVSETSPLTEKTLKEARVHEERCIWILALKRGEKTLRPKGDSKSSQEIY